VGQAEPLSAYQLAAEAMKEAEDKILATAFRKLAKSDANGAREFMTTDDVVNWLDEVTSNIEWLKDHLRHHPVDLEADILALVPEARREQCEWCGDWFVPERRTARFCKQACHQAAYRVRRDAKATEDLP
jgi:hypothetical protein